MEQFTSATRTGINNIANQVRGRFCWRQTPQGFEYWQTVVNNLKALAVPPAREDRRSKMIKYGSPDLPGGYDTVLGFVARHPDLSHLLTDNPHDTARDGVWCARVCAQRGLMTCKVPAPHVLRDRGINVVNAYPVGIIAERFDNPRDGSYTKRNWRFGR